MCSYAAALFIYGIYNLSRTDVECLWKKPNAPDISRKSIAEMFPPTSQDIQPYSDNQIKEIEKRCIQNAEHVESSLAYVGC